MNRIDEINKKLDAIEEKEEMRDMLPKGFKAMTGVVWADKQVEEYNRLQKRINTFIKAGKPVPEELLNGSHNLFTMFSKK